MILGDDSDLVIGNDVFRFHVVSVPVGASEAAALPPRLRAAKNGTSNAVAAALADPALLAVAGARPWPLAGSTANENSNSGSNNSSSRDRAGVVVAAAPVAPPKTLAAAPTSTPTSAGGAALYSLMRATVGFDAMNLWATVRSVCAKRTFVDPIAVLIKRRVMVAAPVGEDDDRNGGGGGGGDRLGTTSVPAGEWVGGALICVVNDIGDILGTNVNKLRRDDDAPTRVWLPWFSPSCTLRHASDALASRLLRAVIAVAVRVLRPVFANLESLDARRMPLLESVFRAAGFVKSNVLTGTVSLDLRPEAASSSGEDEDAVVVVAAPPLSAPSTPPPRGLGGETATLRVAKQAPAPTSPPPSTPRAAATAASATAAVAPAKHYSLSDVVGADDYVRGYGGPRADAGTTVSTLYAGAELPESVRSGRIRFRLAHESDQRDWNSQIARACGFNFGGHDMAKRTFRCDLRIIAYEARDDNNNADTTTGGARTKRAASGGSGSGGGAGVGGVGTSQPSASSMDRRTPHDEYIAAETDGGQEGYRRRRPGSAADDDASSPCPWVGVISVTRSGFVPYLFVDSAYRKQGIGKLLLAIACEWIRCRQLLVMFWDNRKDSDVTADWLIYGDAALVSRLFPQRKDCDEPNVTSLPMTKLRQKLAMAQAARQKPDASMSLPPRSSASASASSITSPSALLSLCRQFNSMLFGIAAQRPAVDEATAEAPRIPAVDAAGDSSTATTTATMIKNGNNTTRRKNTFGNDADDDLTLLLDRRREFLRSRLCSRFATVDDYRYYERLGDRFVAVSRGCDDAEEVNSAGPFGLSVVTCEMQTPTSLHERFGSVRDCRDEIECELLLRPQQQGLFPQGVDASPSGQASAALATPQRRVTHASTLNYKRAFVLSTLREAAMPRPRVTIDVLRAEAPPPRAAAVVASFLSQTPSPSAPRTPLKSAAATQQPQTAAAACGSVPTSRGRILVTDERDEPQLSLKPLTTSNIVYYKNLGFGLSVSGNMSCKGKRLKRKKNGEPRKQSASAAAAAGLRFSDLRTDSDNIVMWHDIWLSVPQLPVALGDLVPQLRFDFADLIAPSDEQQQQQQQQQEVVAGSRRARGQ